ncbi:glycerophosphodiester phosphodiesterase [Clostridium niameyense]|uniref:Glycerophosphodiester phosphodiesterase n=1 Tax=Clostridium niameyense TaxID=1622073 RepID=A0A6M0R6C3_9CLOT|nr:glycerophosphodiester phosphodiesterase [Clostridium niameyense]NEZ45731.1 glycerophosphodiester phosphodiesterase [Clostridium niameyense]
MIDTKIMAHRGAAAYAPENTIAAFTKAIEMKADAIELDIHLSKDDHIVVIHDEKVDRTTNGKGLVMEFTLEELKRLDAGSWFNKEFKNEKIPTLREVLELVAYKNIDLNIEIKAGYRVYPNIEEKLLRLLKEYEIMDRCIISSFDHYSLVKIKNLCLEIKTGMLYSASLYEPWDYAKSIKVDALHPFYITVTEDFIKKAYMNSLEINPYTVDDEIIMGKLALGGVSNIITNYPDKAKNIISNI